MADKKIQVAFAAVEKEYEKSIPSYEQNEQTNKGYVPWGENNTFPEYLNALYEQVTTLRTIINGTSDFVVGDGISSTVANFTTTVNKRGDTWEDLIGQMSRDYLVYGNAYCQVIKSKAGEIAELYYISARYIRSSKKNDLFYYSENYGKKYARQNKTLVYPKFVYDSDAPTSIICIKSECDKTYGLPRYIASLKDCEVERQLSEFDLSLVENSFFSNYAFSFNNGIPSDEQKAEIERDIAEKYCGSSNAGRVLITFADSKDNSLEITPLNIENYAEKFSTTQDRARNQIYAAFGCQPVLFGIQKETAGFSDEDYQQAFKLYNRVVVRPLQKKFVNLFNKVFGIDGSLVIKPFTIDWSDDGENNTEQTVN